MNEYVYIGYIGPWRLVYYNRDKLEAFMVNNVAKRLNCSPEDLIWERWGEFAQLHQRDGVYIDCHYREYWIEDARELERDNVTLTVSRNQASLIYNAIEAYLTTISYVIPYDEEQEYNIDRDKIFAQIRPDEYSRKEAKP